MCCCKSKETNNLPVHVVSDVASIANAGDQIFERVPRRFIILVQVNRQQVLRNLIQNLNDVNLTCEKMPTFDCPFCHKMFAGGFSAHLNKILNIMVLTLLGAYNKNKRTKTRARMHTRAFACGDSFSQLATAARLSVRANLIK